MGLRQGATAGSGTGCLKGDWQRLNYMNNPIGIGPPIKHWNRFTTNIGSSIGSGIG